jgi:hypothetical protein
MSRNLTVNFTIPLSDEDWAGPCFIFEQWIPENESDVIVVNHEGKEVRIYADKSCVSSLNEVTDDLISRWQNISVSKLKIEVVLNDIEDELLDFMYAERESPKEIHHGLKPGEDGYEELKIKYEQIGNDIGNLAISLFNRTVSYTRNIKGQYWLSERKIDENSINNQNVSLNAKAKINNENWFRWCPPCKPICLRCNIDTDSSIKKDEWKNVIEFVNDRSRPNLIFELISNSRYLYAHNHYRSSVIEAISALEVAVSNFGRNANTDMLSRSYQINRVDIHNIGNQISHLGFSGSMRYLIPLLFNEEELPCSVLEKCFQAIEVRNNVVHQGQRNVAPDLVQEILRGVSLCCRVLDRYTKKMTPNQRINADG